MPNNRLCTLSGQRAALFAALLAALLVLPMAGVRGQDREADSPPRNSEEKSDSRDRNGDGEKTESQAGERADDVFKPSEEISEDLSVPFPVDI